MSSATPGPSARLTDLAPLEPVAQPCPAGDARRLKLAQLHDGWRAGWAGLKEIDAVSLHNMLVKQQENQQQQQQEEPGSIAQPKAGAKRVFVVDVRTEDEQQVSMLPTAVTKEEFEEAKAWLHGAGVLVVPYCTAGLRSANYCKLLQAEGFEVANFSGSILAWTLEGLPLVHRHLHGSGEGSSGGGGGGAAAAAAAAAASERAAAAAAGAAPAPAAGPAASSGEGTDSGTAPVELTRRVHVYGDAWALQGDGYEPVTFRHPLARGLRDVVGGWLGHLMGRRG